MITNENIIQEVFIPKQRIQITDKEKVFEYQQLYSGKKDLYLSVYNYRNVVSTNTAIIDKIFLDFDYDDELLFFNDVRTVAKFLYDSGYTFCIRFSGRGFHIFIALQENHHNNSSSIKKWVKYMHTKTNTHSDRAVIGDLRRVSRMLGTMNLKTHLYCIPITYEQLMELSYDDICNMARVYQSDEQYNGLFSDYYHYGKSNVDLSKFDIKEPKTIKTNININNVSVQKSFPPCIEKMLSTPDLGYYERGQLLIFLRDQGYSYYEILAILKSVLSEKKYYHTTEEENQPAYLYFYREDLLFGNCNTQKQNGICPCEGYCGGPYLYI